MTTDSVSPQYVLGIAHWPMPLNAGAPATITNRRAPSMLKTRPAKATAPTPSAPHHAPANPYAVADLDKSPEAIAIRRELHRASVHDSVLEGCVPDPDADHIAEAWVNGDITMEQRLAMIDKFLAKKWARQRDGR